MAYETIFKAIPTVRAAFKKKFAHLADGRNLTALFYADNIPQANVDIASKNGDLCLDMGSDDIYVASAVTSSTTTWTKIVD